LTQLFLVSDLSLKLNNLNSEADGIVAIGNPERHVRKALHRGSKQQ